MTASYAKSQVPSQRRSVKVIESIVMVMSVKRNTKHSKFPLLPKHLPINSFEKNAIIYLIAIYIVICIYTCMCVSLYN